MKKREEKEIKNLQFFNALFISCGLKSSIQTPKSGTEDDFVVGAGLAAEHDIVGGIGIRSLAGILEELRSGSGTNSSSVDVLAPKCRKS